MLIDAHCHLANLSKIMPLPPLLEEAAQRQIQGWLSSALTREEIDFYLSNPNPHIQFSAGIHPSYDDCDLSMNDLIDLCEQQSIWAIGEIGLDRQGLPFKEQLRIFEEQLELANSYHLPVVLHIVGHQQEAYDILKKYPLRYLVHGYAGSVEAYHTLAQLNSHFTISDRILKQDKEKLLSAMLMDGRYLFETDITRHYVMPQEQNPLLRLNKLLQEVAERGGIPHKTLIQTQYQGYQKLRGTP